MFSVLLFRIDVVSVELDPPLVLLSWAMASPNDCAPVAPVWFDACPVCWELRATCWLPDPPEDELPLLPEPELLPEFEFLPEFDVVLVTLVEKSKVAALGGKRTGGVTALPETNTPKFSPVTLCELPFWLKAAKAPGRDVVSFRDNPGP